MKCSKCGEIMYEEKDAEIACDNFDAGHLQCKNEVKRVMKDITDNNPPTTTLQAFMRLLEELGWG